MRIRGSEPPEVSQEASSSFSGLLGSSLEVIATDSPVMVLDAGLSLVLRNLPVPEFLARIFA
jgi:hypothetical protein